MKARQALQNDVIKLTTKWALMEGESERMAKEKRYK
jgi:hypothetical protein